MRDPLTEDVGLDTDPEAYGRMKVACEDLVRHGAASAAIVRPGLIVGPGDPTGRFTYWPRRLAEGGEVLAPGNPGDSAQVIDVRDLAAWIVTLAERRTTGDFDGVGPPTTLEKLLREGGPDAALTWVDQAFLTEQGVEPWMGPDAIPLWLPRPEYDGLMAHDVQPSLDAGLEPRPVAETARATLEWLAAEPDAEVSGIGREREQELLAAWHSRTG
jgi:nucleoside-diphosphate-sugar epimerase